MAAEARPTFAKPKPRKAASSGRRRRTAEEPHFRSSVDKSVLIDEIRNLFEANWGASAVNRWLTTRYADRADLLAAVPSVDALQRWRRKNARPKSLIPTNVLFEMIGRTQAIVDVLAYYEALVPLLANRLGEALKLEQNLGGMLTGSVDKAASTFLSAAKQLWEAGQDLGMYPLKPVAPHLLLGIDANAGADETLTDLEQTAMWEAIYRVRHGEELPQLESPRAKAQREALEEGEDGTE